MQIFLAKKCILLQKTMILQTICQKIDLFCHFFIKKGSPLCEMSLFFIPPLAS